MPMNYVLIGWMRIKGCVGVCMDERMRKWTSVRTDGRIDKRVCGSVHGGMQTWMRVQMHKQMYM